MIQFKKVRNSDAVIEYLTEAIRSKLTGGQKILWLVAGGSAMDIAIQTARILSSEPNLANLTVSLTDERFGPVDHADSNWRQLAKKGFSLPPARMLPVLINKSLGETVAANSDLMKEALAEADFSIALAGMGPDGHIFGIKPGSPAVNSPDPMVGYEWEDYIRITPTLNMIKKLDEVVVYAAGQEKYNQIDNLNDKIEADQQPAQLLKHLKNVVFFNDYKGEDV